MKTKEELNALKEEVETLNKKLAELSEDELKLVVGGGVHKNDPDIEDLLCLTGENLYVFTTGEMIWANSAQTRYFRVNEDVSTNQAEQSVSVTQVTPGASMFEPQQITMTVRTLKEYLDEFGRR